MVQRAAKFWFFRKPEWNNSATGGPCRDQDRYARSTGQRGCLGRRRAVHGQCGRPADRWDADRPGQPCRRQSQDFLIEGLFGPAPHTASINFINDAYGGTPDTDRNLYVNGAAIDGQTIASSTLTLWSNGPQSFAFQGASVDGGGLSLTRTGE